MPDFTCDLDHPAEPLRPIWTFCVGSGHARLALRADWQRQLTRARREIGFEHVRFHGLFADDMKTLVEHQNQLRYSCTPAARKRRSTSM